MKKILVVVLIALVCQGCVDSDSKKTERLNNPIVLEVCSEKSTSYISESKITLEPGDCYGVYFYKLGDITKNAKFLKVSGDANVRITRLEKE